MPTPTTNSALPAYEKLGAFYLGKGYDLASKSRTDDLLLYDSRDLVTHAVCVGMTGSGKTGLCLGLLEEAAIDGIPSIIIDPKGDLSNLLLTFPGLSAALDRTYGEHGWFMFWDEDLSGKPIRGTISIAYGKETLVVG